MTLQERQKREKEMLELEIAEISHKQRIAYHERNEKENALQLLCKDPEAYFKNIDKEE